MRAFRPIALAVLMSTVAGCAFRPQVAGMAVEYNEFVAEATNRQTVVNILRARSREPLHFTSFSKVLGTARIEGTAGLDVAANGDGGERLAQAGGGFATSRRTLGATNWTPRLGVKVNSGTDFEIGINATDDFWKGITAPVSPATIVHLLRQDWPRDLVSYLFIQRVEFAGRITGPDGKVVATVPLSRFVNAPDNESTVDPFTNLIRCRTLYYTLSETPRRDLPIGAVGELSGVPSDVLPRLSPKAAPDAGYSVAIPGRSEFTIALAERPAESGAGRNEACLELERTLRDEFARSLERRRIELPRPAAPADEAKPAPGAAGAADEDPFPGSANYLAAGAAAASPNGAGFTAAGYFRGLVPEGYKTELLIDVSLRSVEGMIYYLGEYVRESNKRPMALGRCADGSYGECIPLIVVRPADAAGEAEPFISVDYKGRRYVVPSSGENIRADGGYSSLVVALVQQMLNLYRSSKDLPSTPLVRVIN